MFVHVLTNQACFIVSLCPRVLFSYQITKISRTIRQTKAKKQSGGPLHTRVDDIPGQVSTVPFRMRRCLFWVPCPQVTSQSLHRLQFDNSHWDFSSWIEHDGFWQKRSSFWLGQGASSVREVICLVRVWRPSPQSAVHLLHLLHSETSQIPDEKN
eukprot:sb/3473200/